MAVRADDWLGSDSEEITNFGQERFEGREGHRRMQLEKTFKGDDRFKLTNEFDVSIRDAEKVRANLPDTMIGAMSKKELEDLRNPN